MKKIALGFLVMLGVMPLAYSSTIPALSKALNAWQPRAIEPDGNDIYVTMETNHITWDIYRSVVPLGVCAPLWLKEGGKSYLKGIKNIYFMNSFNVSGYALEEPLKTCNQLNTTKDDKLNIVIASHTHGVREKQDPIGE